MFSSLHLKLFVSSLLLALAVAYCSGDGGTTQTATTSSYPVQQPAAPVAAVAPSAPASTAAGAPIAAADPAVPTGGASVVIPAVEPKVDRVVFAVGTLQREHNTPGKVGEDSFQLRPMYEYLVGMDPVTGLNIPQLATEWSVEPDGKSFRFKLRKGVQFQGGWGEFTARDVIHTFDDLTADDSGHVIGTQFRNGVEAVEAVNDYEIVWRTNKADADMLPSLAESFASMEIQSKAHFDEAGLPTLVTPPIAGTGPYQYDERSIGFFVRYQRVPYKQWRITPDFPELEIVTLPDASTTIAALLVGDIHMANVPEDLVPQLSQAGMKPITGNVPGLRTFVRYHCCYRDLKAEAVAGALEPRLFPDAPLWDLRLRKALNKAIDRDEINTAFFGGEGDLMMLQNSHPTRLGWNPEWEKRFQAEYGYDPAAAKNLLAEAGYGPNNPYEIKIIPQNLPHYSGSEDVMEAVMGFWRNVGIKPTFAAFSRSEFSAKRRAFELNNHVSIRATSSAIVLAYRVYVTSHIPRGSAMEFKDMDDIFTKIRGTLDTAKQHEGFLKIGELSFQRHVNVPLFWLPAKVMVNPEIVSDYIFPGSITGTWTHLDQIKAAR